MRTSESLNQVPEIIEIERLGEPNIGVKSRPFLIVLRASGETDEPRRSSALF